MILEVYSVFDKAVGAYLQPFYCRSSGEAMRSFSEACNKEDNQFNRHASDYYLVRLGQWDDAAGIFITGDPTRVISANEVIVRDDPEKVVPAVASQNGGFLQRR